MSNVAVFLVALFSSWILTWVVLKTGRRIGKLDIPNERSSHVVATPRGGGIAFVLIILVGTALLGVSGGISPLVASGLGIGGLLIGSIGYLDDHFGLTPRLRLVVHLLAATLGTCALIWQAQVSIFPAVPLALSVVLVVLANMWSINLYNFMDGIDGIATSEALFVAGSMLILAKLDRQSSDAVLLLLTAGACSGFLVWNWPPAKIFMGDVGSGFLGFWLAALGMHLHLLGALSIWTSIILLSVFVADATTTLLIRTARGERWYEAHRSHAYQILARCWNHRRATLLVCVVNIALVFPLAYHSVSRPEAAIYMAGAALLLLSGVSYAIGAGRRNE